MAYRWRRRAQSGYLGEIGIYLTALAISMSAFSMGARIECLYVLLESASMTLSPNFPDNFAQPLINIGNVHVTEKQIITPAGSWPLAEVNVTTVDQTSTTTHTPGWAIVMVILFIWFFLLSLLFLLARETRTRGYVAIHIQAGPRSYTEQVPVVNALQRDDVFNRVAYLSKPHWPSTPVATRLRDP